MVAKKPDTRTKRSIKRWTRGELKAWQGSNIFSQQLFAAIWRIVIGINVLRRRRRAIV